MMRLPAALFFQGFIHRIRVSPNYAKDVDERVQPARPLPSEAIRMCSNG